MKHWFRNCALVVALALLSPVARQPLHGQRGGGQDPAPSGRPGTAGDDGDVKLPNGKSQRDEILRLDREQNIKDADLLIQLAEDLKEDIEKNDRYVLSMSTLKKKDDIEKMV